MLALRDLQLAFCAAIRSRDAAGLVPLIRENGIAANERLQVYRNNHRIGVRETLQAAFPVIARLGGPDWFAQCALNYQRACPSRSGDLQNLGERFPDFLRGEFAGTEFGYFADVAALEWAYQLVLTAADAPGADPEVLRKFAAEDYERLRFVPRPALRLVDSAYPVFAIWHANQPPFDRDVPAIRLDCGPSRVLVIRRRGEVELRELPAGSHHLLRQFQLGAALGEAAASAARAVPDFDLGASLGQVMTLEAIQAISLDGARGGE